MIIFTVRQEFLFSHWRFSRRLLAIFGEFMSSFLRVSKQKMLTQLTVHNFVFQKKLHGDKNQTNLLRSLTHAVLTSRHKDNKGKFEGVRFFQNLEDIYLQHRIRQGGRTVRIRNNCPLPNCCPITREPKWTIMSCHEREMKIS